MARLQSAGAGSGPEIKRSALGRAPLRGYVHYVLVDCTAAAAAAAVSHTEISNIGIC